MLQRAVPVASGAIIPRPSGGQVYLRAADKTVPYGRPLTGNGERCQVGNLPATKPAAPQTVPSQGVRIRTDEAEPLSPKTDIPLETDPWRGSSAPSFHEGSWLNRTFSGSPKPSRAPNVEPDDTAEADSVVRQKGKSNARPSRKGSVRRRSGALLPAVSSPWVGEAEPLALGVATGGDHTCARSPDGTLGCWGDNSRGQLGDGTTLLRTTPVQLSGLSGVTAVALGDQHTCALQQGARCTAGVTTRMVKLETERTRDRPSHPCA